MCGAATVLLVTILLFSECKGRASTPPPVIGASDYGIGFSVGSWGEMFEK